MENNPEVEGDVNTSDKPGNSDIDYNELDTEKKVETKLTHFEAQTSSNESNNEPQDFISYENNTEDESRRAQDSVPSTSSSVDYAVRTTKSVDVVPSHKFKTVARISGKNADLAQKYNLSLTSPHARRPLGIKVKKPKLSYSLEGCKEIPNDIKSDSSLNSGTNISSSSTSEITNHLANTVCTDSSFRLTDSDGFISDCVSEKFDLNISEEKNLVKEDINTCTMSSNENEKEAQSFACDYIDDTITETDTVYCEETACDEGNNIKSDNSRSSKDKQETEDAGVGDSKPSRSRQEIVGDTLINKNIADHSCTGTMKSDLINDYGDLGASEVQLKESKMKSLKKILEQCPEGADMKLSLFMASCSHNMRILQPFPDKIFPDDEANRLLLYHIAEEIPSVSMVITLLEDNGHEPVRKEILPIVDWLIRREDPRLELVNDQEHKSILSKISQVSENYFPSKIFRIKTKRISQIEESWRVAKNDYSTKLAYHMCKVDQAHTLLYHGLNNQINKRGIFGPGIYLTDNLAACINACIPGNTWGKSSIATKVKIIFIAEFVSNHNVTTYDGQGYPFNNKVDDKEKTNYYFISKPKIVRLRFLLVYIIEDSVLSKQSLNGLEQEGRVHKRFLKYLKLFRISLLIATLIMGIVSASKKNADESNFSMSSLIGSLRKCYQKATEDFQKWSLWQYVETPYLAVHLWDSVPHTCADTN